MPAHSPAAERAVFTVTPHEGGWAVMFEGDVFDESRDRNETIAAAHKRARACHDGGRPAQVAISGEVSFADRGAALRRRIVERQA